MLLIFHIFVAVTSVLYTAFVFFAPTKQRIFIAYILVALMLISGFGLLLQFPASITQTCEEGLVYLAIIAAGIIGAHSRLPAYTTK